MNILITGASGFIGRNLISFLQERGINIIALTRDKRNFDDNNIKVIEELEELPSNYQVHSIINLAGAPIDKRWSKHYKQILLNSRIDITKKLYTLVARLHVKPKSIISASAVGFYGDQKSTIIDENSEPNDEFTHKLCKQWEQEIQKIDTFGCSIFIIRLGVVLGKNGGMLGRLLPVFKMGLGGKIGSGAQYISWVHIEDVLRAVLFLLESDKSSSVYNLTSPSPVTNLEWTKVFASTVNRPAFFAMHTVIVRLLFGEMGDALLLKGNRVVPKRLEQEGFEFKYSKLKKALDEIVN